jgi:hypothetical protein
VKTKDPRVRRYYVKDVFTPGPQPHQRKFLYSELRRRRWGWRDKTLARGRQGEMHAMLRLCRAGVLELEPVMRVF